MRKMNTSRILLINFDRNTQRNLHRKLRVWGHTVVSARTIQHACQLLEHRLFKVVLTDINGSTDLAILKTIRERSHQSEVIVLASYANLDTAVKTLKMGAYDYMVRPIDDEKIRSTIGRALSNGTVYKKDKVILKHSSSTGGETFYDLVGKSEAIRKIYSLIERVADSRATILIHGESGTGKRMIAHAIHRADRKRRNKPFIEISCGALPRDIIESELFGHTKGAFTSAITDRKGRFELAHGGTMLLDDIDSLPLELQTKLLRVLQQREFERVGDHKTIKVDVRIIATTNQDIRRAVIEKRFREDLYYRINVISLHVPPLRERADDLSLLVNHFVHYYAKENSKKIKGVSEDALNALMKYGWPGNIRELENIIERAVILDVDNIVRKDDLPEILLNEHAFIDAESKPSVIHSFSTPLKQALQEPEKIHIIRVLKEVGGNKKAAAKKLGVNRTTLYNKLRKYNIFSHSDAL